MDEEEPVNDLDYYHSVISKEWDLSEGWCGGFDDDEEEEVEVDEEESI